MKTRSKILLLLMLLNTRCISTEEPGIATQTTIFNTSGREIEIQRFGQGKHFSSIHIKDNESTVLNVPSKDGTGKALPYIQLDADSIRVFYYEEASIWHNKEENQVVSKSLLLESSYDGGKVNDTRYEFTYTFTEDDFQEAVDFGD